MRSSRVHEFGKVYLGPPSCENTIHSGCTDDKQNGGRQWKVETIMARLSREARWM